MSFFHFILGGNLSSLKYHVELCVIYDSHFFYKKQVLSLQRECFLIFCQIQP